MDFSANQLFFDFYGIRIQQITPDGRNFILFTGSDIIAFNNPVQVDIGKPPFGNNP